MLRQQQKQNKEIIVTTESDSYLTELHTLINQHFDLAEIRTLCFKLNLDYESVAGEEKPSRIRELLLKLGRNGRLSELITLLQQERPNVDWTPVPDDFELPESLAFNEETLAGAAHIGQIGDIFNVGDITGRYTAIGNGAQVIVNQIEQVLSATEEREKDTQVAENRLARAIQTKIENYTRLPATVGLEGHRNPYRSLLNYRIEDAPFFYGRQEAIQAMLMHLDRNRLTVLQSASGSGKTSLLQAGLAARLLAARHLPLYIRPYNEPPHMAIKRAFLPDYKTLDELKRFRDDKMSLLGFLRRVTNYLGPRKLFIFLDQFEEFFNNLTPERRAFSLELQQCIDDPQLDVGWVLSLREEYFAKLRLFEAIRPFENWCFLETFHVKEAREVITQPALKMGVSYEKHLVDYIIKDVSNDGETLIPVHVQLVCATLFDERYEQSDATIISAELYNRERGQGGGDASGAKGILRSHLSHTIQQQMTRQERKLAWQVLRTLVTSQKHRTQRNRQKILQELQTVNSMALVDEPPFDNVLKILENNRLIRTDEDDEGEMIYELSHDYLLDEIEVDPQFQAIKLAQEILAQEMPFYVDRGVLLSQDKYDIVNSQREYLHLDEVSLELLKKSEARFEEERTKEIQQAKTLAKQSEEARRQAVRVSHLILALLSIVTAISIVLIAIYVVIPWFMKNDAKNGDYADLVPVEMSDGSVIKFESFEVTNDRYAKCVEWGQCNEPDGFEVIYPEWPASFSDQQWQNSKYLPVTNIDARNAMKFCEWIGRTLPTAEQWLTAAPPPTSWPDLDELQKATYCLINEENGNCQLPLSMGNYVQKRPQFPNGLSYGDKGIYDLVGNVEEWTRTIYNPESQQCIDVDRNKLSEQKLDTIVFALHFQSFSSDVDIYSNYRNVKEFTRWNHFEDVYRGFRCVEISDGKTEPAEMLFSSNECPNLGN